MNRASYLANTDVQQFGNWLRDGLDTNRSAHSWIDRRSQELWTFQSLRDAALLYKWPFKIVLPGGHQQIVGQTLVENGNALSVLANGLCEAVVQRDDQRTLAWATIVLKWGGVTNKNPEWLQNNQEGLAEYLAFEAERLDDPLTDAENLGDIRRYNAGMTKIFSLLLDSHIIYDSRVAAALALMVRRYCEAFDLAAVPEPLRYALPPGRSEQNQRGPHIGGYRFPAVNGSHARRNALSARSALYASWLLKGVVLQAGADAVFDGPDFPDEMSSLRGLEAALFMVGYDVRDPTQQRLAA